VPQGAGTGEWRPLRRCMTAADHHHQTHKRKSVGGAVDTGGRINHRLGEAAARCSTTTTAGCFTPSSSNPAASKTLHNQTVVGAQSPPFSAAPMEVSFLWVTPEKDRVTPAQCHHGVQDGNQYPGPSGLLKARTTRWWWMELIASRRPPMSNYQSRCQNRAPFRRNEDCPRVCRAHAAEANGGAQQIRRRGRQKDMPHRPSRQPARNAHVPVQKPAMIFERRCSKDLSQ